jgi:hypothetical protein
MVSSKYEARREFHETDFMGSSTLEGAAAHHMYAVL